MKFLFCNLSHTFGKEDTDDKIDEFSTYSKYDRYTNHYSTFLIAEFYLLTVIKEYLLEMSPKANMRRLEANMNKINTMKFRTNSNWANFSLN